MRFRDRLIRVGFGLAAVAVLIGCQTKVKPATESALLFDPQVAAVEERVRTIAQGLERYKIDTGDYPQKLDDLFASDAPGWKGPTCAPVHKPLRARRRTRQDNNCLICGAAESSTATTRNRRSCFPSGRTSSRAPRMISW